MNGFPGEIGAGEPFEEMIMNAIRLAITGLALGSALIAQDAVLARGKYLVEEVAKCQECHTVRTAAGEPDKTKWLKGGALDTRPAGEIAKWHTSSPDITSASSLFQRWGVEGMIKFPETGKNPRGNPADRPMPAYQMQHDDAVAVVTYLKSLP
jgi:mono/diheme cytochrome c family protein